MVDINPFLIGALGGFLNALFTYIKKNFINPPIDAKVDHKYEVKLLLATGFSYALAGGVLAALLALSSGPPVWSLVIGLTAPQFIFKMVG